MTAAAMRPCAMLALVIAPLSSGCSASKPQPQAPVAARTTRVAVLPALWVTPGDHDRNAATTAALEGLRATPSVAASVAVLPPSDPSDEASPCQEDPACVRRISAELHATRAVVIKLAELGGTVLARVTLIDAEAGTQEQTRQTVVHSAELSKVAAAVRSMALELGRPFGPPPPPAQRSLAWYERWWVWAGGGTVLTSAVAIPLVLLRNRNEPGSQPTPDVVITPP